MVCLERPGITLANMTITPKLLLDQSTVEDIINSYIWPFKQTFPYIPAVSPTKKQGNKYSIKIISNTSKINKFGDKLRKVSSAPVEGSKDNQL